MSEQLTEQEKALEKIVMTRLARLSATIYGIVFGLVLGIVIFFATLWLVIRGGPVVGPNLSLLGQFFIGYTVTYMGSLIGFVYGFVAGFIIGFSIATIYNWIIGRLTARHPEGA
jgi:tetrahydromethanopterin S-methyltransferase subunit G